MALTLLSAALVVAALTAPTRLEDLRVSAFLRLPVEALLLVAAALVLPARWARARTALALTGGLVIGVAAVFKLLDVGVHEALNRPFDPLIDWRYAGSLAETVRDSFGPRLGTALVVGAGVAVVVLLVGLPLALLRLTRVAGRHRARAVPAVAVLTAGWLVVGLLDVRGPAGRSRPTTPRPTSRSRSRGSRASCATVASSRRRRGPTHCGASPPRTCSAVCAARTS